MRERFELCVKVVGLVLFCSGVLAALTTLILILWYVTEPTGDRSYPPELLQNNPFAQKLREYESSSRRAQKMILLTSFLFTTATVCMGLYLMRSGKLLIRLCYPQEDNGAQSHGAAGPHGVDLHLHGAGSERAEHAETRPDNKYAPPGYFEQA